MNPKHWLCIVHACRNRAIACCRSRHGWHAYCADHHFARTGMDRPYATPPELAGAPKAGAPGLAIPDAPDAPHGRGGSPNAPVPLAPRPTPPTPGGNAAPLRGPALAGLEF